MKEVNWTKWAAISEIIGSVAIVITLIYLAIETQQNTAATQASSRDTVIESDLAVVQMMVEKPALRLNMYKQELTDAEAVELELFLVGVARTREHQWLQYKNGLLDRETLDAFLTGVTLTFSRPRTREWWNTYAYAYFNDEFVDEVNEFLQDTPIEQNFNNPSAR